MEGEKKELFRYRVVGYKNKGFVLQRDLRIGKLDSVSIDYKAGSFQTILNFDYVPLTGGYVLNNALYYHKEVMNIRTKTPILDILMMYSKHPAHYVYFKDGKGVNFNHIDIDKPNGYSLFFHPENAPTEHVLCDKTWLSYTGYSDIYNYCICDETYIFSDKADWIIVYEGDKE